MGALQGKVAIVTGASRGIGAVTARRLAAEGAALYLAANNTEAALAAVAADCRKVGPAGAEFGIFDFVEPGSLENMVERTLSTFGRVDILVNNAGIRIRHPFGEFTNEEFDHMVAVNVKAAFFASQAVLPAMRKVGGGRIIHIASQMGLVAEQNSALYGMTKAALIHLTKSMAFELAREGIIVNAVSPGPTMTEYNRERTAKDPDLLAYKLSYIPTGRYAEPEEIADAVLYLATTSVMSIQGHNLVVDGGYTIH